MRAILLSILTIITINCFSQSSVLDAIKKIRDAEQPLLSFLPNSQSSVVADLKKIVRIINYNTMSFS